MFSIDDFLYTKVAGVLFKPIENILKVSMDCDICETPFFNYLTNKVAKSCSYWLTATAAVLHDRFVRSLKLIYLAVVF